MQKKWKNAQHTQEELFLDKFVYGILRGNTIYVREVSAIFWNFHIQNILCFYHCPQAHALFNGNKVAQCQAPTQPSQHELHGVYTGSMLSICDHGGGAPCMCGNGERVLKEDGRQMQMNDKTDTLGDMSVQWHREKKADRWLSSGNSVEFSTD